MVNPNELLPKEAATLSLIRAFRPGAEAQYKPKLSGEGHYLAYLDSERDAAEIAAYHADVANGTLTVMLAGETPELLDKRASDDADAREAFMKGVNANWNRILDERKAREEAKLKEIQDRINANYDRWRRQ